MYTGRNFIITAQECLLSCKQHREEGILPKSGKDGKHMKKLSLLLAIVMLISSIGLAAFAEDTAPAAIQSRYQSYDEVNAAITIIPAEGDQAELGYLDGLTEILEVDGLKFKDLNKNGQLDVYEDWRADVEDRVKDLYDQMTLEEKAGLFYHVNTCGNPSGVDFADSTYMFGMDADKEALGVAVPAEEAAPSAGEGESSGEPAAEGEGESAGGMGGGGAAFEDKSMWYYINVLNITTHLDNTNGTPAQQITYHNAMQALGEESRFRDHVCRQPRHTRAGKCPGYRGVCQP